MIKATKGNINTCVEFAGKKSDLLYEYNCIFR